MERKVYFRSVKNCNRILLFSISLLFLSQVTLLANQLLYQPTGSGKVTGFDVSITLLPHERPVSYWHGEKREAWNFKNSAFYVGRIIYVGEPAVPLTITNMGPLPTSGSGYNVNKFYWTQMSGDGADWTEYYIVLRPKGFCHDDATQDDYLNRNIVIQETGGSITLERGAGPSTELVAVGETGFNEKGKAGTYNGSNGFKYKYQYKAIFIDISLIPSNNNHWTRRPVIKYPQYGFYESNLKFTVPGNTLSFALQGKHGEEHDPPPNPACKFDIESFYSDPVPYEILRNYHYSLATALEIGALSYASPSCQAVVTLASNAAGTETDFAFKSETTNETIPHRLVYHCTTGREGDCNGPIVVSNNRKSFYAYHDPVGPPSPIEGTLGPGNYLEATLKLFIDPTSKYPSSGKYTSTIYVILERYQ